MKNGLNALINPLSIPDFLEHFRTNKPFVVHHEGSELRELRDLPFLSSLESLLKSWPGPIDAHLPDARDEVSSISTSPKDAQKLFDCGMGLLFNDANQISDTLENWVQQIRSDLGLPKMTYGRSLIYATPDGKGTAPHFDQNINFVLQIHGTKKWTMAKNESVINPMVRHTMGRAVDPEMMNYLEDEMPEEMPEEKFSFELKPGSLLFVPRGVWHATEAEGHALSLNFTFTPPAWADLFLTALRSRLIQSPEWRETALLSSRFDAENSFDELLHGLIRDIPNWNASDILDATESD